MNNINLKHLIKEQLQEILIEGRVDDFKKMVAGKIKDDNIEKIIKDDNSKDHKNLLWIGKIIINEPDVDYDELKSNLELFNKIGKNTDLYQFKDYISFTDFLEKKHKDSQNTKIAAIKRNSKIIANTSRWLIVAPRGHDSCKYFGGGTSWCISTSNTGYWNSHYYDNTIIIVKDRNKNPDDRLFKVAIVGRANSYYDADNNLEFLTDHITFYDKNDKVLTKNEKAEYIKELPEELITDIVYYFDRDDVDDRHSEYLHRLASEKFQDDGKLELIDELVGATLDFLKINKRDIEIDYDDFEQEMQKEFAEEFENGNFDQFLRQLWDACINYQGVEDDDFHPSIHSRDIKSLIDNTDYGSDDYFEIAKKVFNVSKDFDTLDDIIQQSLIKYSGDQDPYYNLSKIPDYRQVLIQAFNMYNNKVNPSIMQGQQALPGFYGIQNKYTPKNIDDVIKILSIHPRAINMIKYINRYRKDLRELKKSIKEYIKLSFRTKI